jgi:hypothetical protein
VAQALAPAELERMTAEGRRLTPAGARDLVAASVGRPAGRQAGAADTTAPAAGRR